MYGGLNDLANCLPTVYTGAFVPVKPANTPATQSTHTCPIALIMYFIPSPTSKQETPIRQSPSTIARAGCDRLVVSSLTLAGRLGSYLNLVKTLFATF